MLNLLLLAGKFAFLIVLYLFIFMVIRSAVRDVRRVGERPPAVRPVAAAALTPGQGVWTLAVEESPELEAGALYAVSEGRPLEIGRSGSVDLRLRDTFVSSHHARLEATPDGLLVRDLGSTNGTYVNGEEIAEAWLEPGDRLAVGDSVFRVGIA